MENVKIILVDDKKVYRNATKLLLKKIGNNEVIAEASNGKEFLYIIDNLDADIVFMDIEMPEINGIEAAKQILQKKPELLVIGLSLYDDQNYIDQLLNVGARGYLLKLSNNYSVIETIIRAPKAEIFFSKEIDPDRPQKKSEEKTILVVDDFEHTRFIVDFTLQKEGYKIVQASSGNEALQKIEVIKFDLIITDFEMPRMNGITLAKKIKQHKGYQDIPILLLTISRNHAIEQQAKDVGITDRIHKPFVMDKFIDTVKRVMSERIKN